MSFYERLGTLITTLIVDIFTSPVNLFLFGLCLFLIYKILRQTYSGHSIPHEEKAFVPLGKLKKRDFTVDELRAYNGRNMEGRILVAVNGKVFDVTNNGRDYYGPDGPYSIFAGRDASRSLATFSLDKHCFKEAYDDLSDLNTDQMEQLKEWELQFDEKYSFVGKLLRPGEAHTHYSDVETDVETDV